MAEDIPDQTFQVLYIREAERRNLAPENHFFDIKETTLSGEKSLESAVQEWWEVNDLRRGIAILHLESNRSGDLEGIGRITEWFPDLYLLIVMESLESNALKQAIKAGVLGIVEAGEWDMESDLAIQRIKKGEPFLSPRVTRMAMDLLNPRIQKEGFSPKTRVVLKGLVEGQGYDEIARNSDLKLNTVRFHVKKIYKAYGVNSQGKLMARYHAGGL